MEDYGSSKDFLGVGGWLLFFCFSMIFFNPIMTVYQLFTYPFPLLSKTHDVRREILWSVNSVLFLGVSAFGVVAGIRLWLVCAGAGGFGRLGLPAALGAAILFFF